MRRSQLAAVAKNFLWLRLHSVKAGDNFAAIITLLAFATINVANLILV